MLTVRNAAITEHPLILCFLFAGFQYVRHVAPSRTILFLLFLQTFPRLPNQFCSLGTGRCQLAAVKLGKDEKGQETRGEGRLVYPEEWRWCICNFGTGFFPCQQAKKK